MNEEELNQYSCDSFIQDEEIVEVLKNISIVSSEYESFITKLENFFNSKIESEEEYNSLKGDIIELSDASERFFIPFKKENGRLKFVESEIWRTTIVMTLLLMKTQKKIH